MTVLNAPHYIGRFAPSPSGPLHFGSLVTALASYLDARANEGRWLLRMEDLDPPREPAGAADAILLSLEAHGLLWDGPVFYQSRRLDAYTYLLDKLIRANLAYPCTCSRQRIRAMGGIYNGRCRLARVSRDKPSAIRLKLEDLPPPYGHLSPKVSFDDLFQGRQRYHLGRDVGDFIIRRKDGLFAYQLAVVADDIEQGITHIIRGSDLLDSTPRQIFLTRVLGAQPAIFGHIPVIVNGLGQKLSKQHGARGLINQNASHNLRLALTSLKLNPPDALSNAQPQQLISWAQTQWTRQYLPRELTAPDLAMTTKR